MANNNAGGPAGGPSGTRLFLTLVIITLVLAGIIGFVVLGPGGQDDPDAGPANGTQSAQPDLTSAAIENWSNDENATESIPLAESFHHNVTTYYESARVFVDRDGEIVMQYNTSASSGEELNAEWSRISMLYAEHVGASETVASLTIITADVGVIVPGPAVEAYTRGDINKEAYLETLEVIDVGDD